MYWLFDNVIYPEEFQAIMRAIDAGMADEDEANFAKATNLISNTTHNFSEMEITELSCAVIRSGDMGLANALLNFSLFKQYLLDEFAKSADCTDLVVGSMLTKNDFGNKQFVCEFFNSLFSGVDIDNTKIKNDALLETVTTAQQNYIQELTNIATVMMKRLDADGVYSILEYLPGADKPFDRKKLYKCLP